MDCRSEQTKHGDLNDSNYLRSRIDQQSELICILKRRADEYLEKSMSQEETLKCLKEKNEQLSKERNQEKEKFLFVEKKLEETISERKKNIEETNVLKSQYDKSVEQINRLENTLKIVNNKLDEKESLVSDMKSSVSSTNSIQKNEDRKMLLKCKNELPVMRQAIADMKLFVSENLKTFQEEFSKIREGVHRIDGEQKSLANKVVTKDEQLVETSKQLEKVKNESELSKTQLKNLEHKFSSANDNLNKNKVIQGLKIRVGELESELESYTVQFDAYKSHASDLLKKEREMNAQLRRIKSRSGLPKSSTNQ